jgi:endonuclease YncB( thermonuclease family)
LALLLACPAAAEPARVIDGDTIAVGSKRVRLYGIDAPETEQRCADGWPAGRIATAELQRLIAGRTLSCETRDRDRYGRTVAVCHADGLDINREMVERGMAWAYRKYSRDYVPVEAVARAGRFGIHGHDCQPAWEWRSK